MNIVNRETWVEYAKLLEQTGVDGLELNFYATPSGFDREGVEIEKEKNIFPWNLSNAKDNRLPLRYVGLLYGNIEGDICSLRGAMDPFR